MICSRCLKSEWIIIMLETDRACRVCSRGGGGDTGERGGETEIFESPPVASCGLKHKAHFEKKLRDSKRFPNRFPQAEKPVF